MKIKGNVWTFRVQVLKMQHPLELLFPDISLPSQLENKDAYIHTVCKSSTMPLILI